MQPLKRMHRTTCIFFFYVLLISFKFYLFIYLWLCWIFVSVRGLSPVVASGGHSSSPFAGLSPSRPLLLQSTGSRRAGSVIAAHGPSCSAACGIFRDQGSHPCPLSLAGGFLTTAPPGKPELHVLTWKKNVCCICSSKKCKSLSKMHGMISFLKNLKF